MFRMKNNRITKPMFLNDGQIVDDNFLPIDSPERVYLWAKYVVKGKISLEKEQILYDSPRLIYFYSKLLIELEIPIPDHLHNFMLMESMNRVDDDQKEFILNFLKLIKKIPE